jgi:Tfp pilus assembly protein PilO
MIYRRQRQQYIFAGILAVIAVVNVLFFFILNRPTRREYERLEDSIRQLQAQLGGNTLYVANREKTSTQLDQFEKDKRALLAKIMTQRTRGYSHIVETLNAMAQRSGVKKTRAGFNLDPNPHAGLNTVTINLPLEGSYSSIVSFIRELENSDTIFLITSISLDSAQTRTQSTNVINSGTGGSGTIALALVLETYFYQ